MKKAGKLGNGGCDKILLDSETSIATFVASEQPLAPKASTSGILASKIAPNNTKSTS